MDYFYCTLMESFCHCMEKLRVDIHNVYFCVSQKRITFKCRCDAFIFRPVESDLNPGHSMVSSIEPHHQEVMSLCEL